MIALDCRMIRHSGIGTYIRGLLSGFTREQLKELVLVGDPEELSVYPCETLPTTEPIYGWREQTFLPARVKRLGPSLYHVPHYNLPLFYDRPLVATVHDLIPLILPSTTRRPLARFYARAMVARMAGGLRRIMADSERTRRDLARFGVPPEKVVVIPLAVDADFRPGDPAPALARFGLEPGYFLYVGNLRAVKNIPRLLEAYRLLRRRNPRVPPLVLAGRDQMPAGGLGAREGIKTLGEVPRDLLPGLYAGAGLFVFPSLYEGFGLPPLEAMACGCPVAASTGGSLPEVLGDAALLLDPADTEGWAAAMERAWSDEALRRGLREKGLRRARGFSWGETARRTFEVYREAGA